MLRFQNTLFTFKIDIQLRLFSKFYTIIFNDWINRIVSLISSKLGCKNKNLFLD